MEESTYKLLAKVLNGSASPSEKEEYEKWIAASVENKKQFSRLEKIWEKSNSVEEDYYPDIFKAWGKVKARTIRKVGLEKPPRPIKLLRVASIAASILLIIGISIVFFEKGNSRLFFDESVTYMAGDSIKEIILDDGSTVWLNSYSLMSIAEKFNSKQRKVKLDGEAFFEVTPNPDMPFTVFANKTITTVLGTSFNISAYGNSPNVSVSVKTGKVKFQSSLRKGNNTNLVAGEIGIFENAKTQIQKAEIINPNYLSWKTGEFFFSNTLLSEACKDLSSYYKKAIILDKNVNINYTLNGNFKQTSLSNLLEIIEFTFDLSSKMQGDTILLSNY